MKEVKKNTGEKALMVFVSAIFASLGVAVIIENRHFSFGVIIAIWFVLLLLYPIIGAFIVRFCAGLRSWAHKYEIESWSERERLILGTFWPCTLIFSIIVYVFLGIIHRIF